MRTTVRKTITTFSFTALAWFSGIVGAEPFTDFHLRKQPPRRPGITQYRRADAVPPGRLLTAKGVCPAVFLGEQWSAGVRACFKVIPAECALSVLARDGRAGGERAGESLPSDIVFRDSAGSWVQGNVYLPASVGYEDADPFRRLDALADNLSIVEYVCNGRKAEPFFPLCRWSQSLAMGKTLALDDGEHTNFTLTGDAATGPSVMVTRASVPSGGFAQAPLLALEAGRECFAGFLVGRYGEAKWIGTNWKALDRLKKELRTRRYGSARGDALR